MYPLKNNHKSGEGLRFLSADEINTIANMLNGLRVDVDQNLDHAEVQAPNQDGREWVIRIPFGGGSITIEETDGDPSIDAVSKIKFDKDHFELTDDGDGEATVAAKVEEKTVVLDVRFDASTLQLQKKTQKMKVILIDGEEESEWTLIEGGQMETCP